MSSQISCPSQPQLEGLLHGTLADPEQVELTAHLETCCDCQQTLEHLAAATQSWSEAAQLLNQAAGSASTAAERLVEQLKAQGNVQPTLVEPASETLRLDYLGPPAQPGHVGTLGPYEIIEVIGRGGMGVVLKAFDPRLHRLAAIKVLAPELASNPAARKRFLREAQAAAAVSHDHVVMIYAIEEAGGVPYLVMEYIAGASLQERLDQRGPFELKEILRIGMQAASGLAAAHAQGLVHRDIKPANILLENGIERVKITDFGLARAVDDVGITQTGVITGTPQYMAPEQARGEPVDHRADLFSLGCVLYAMCTGRPPFRAETTLAAIRRVCEDTPRPIPQVNADMPGWLVEIVDELLAKQPADRFQSAAELAQLLGQHLAHLQQPSLVPPPPRRQRRATSSPVARPSRPTARAAALAVVAAAVLLLGALGLSEATGVTRLGELLATVLRIRTPHGTLVVEVSDPAVKVDVEGNGDAITISGAGLHELRLTPGRHALTAVKDGVPVDRELITITRNGRQIVRIGSEPGAESSTGPLLEALHHPAPVWSVAFSPSGERLAAALRDGRVQLWNAQPAGWQRAALLAGHARGVRTLAFSPDGSRLATGSFDHTARLWDLQSGEALHILKGHGDTVNSLAFSPDGATLATAGLDGAIKLWDVATGALRTTLAQHDDWILCLAFSPDGKLLASAERPSQGPGPAEIKLWEVAAGREVKTLRGHLGWIEALAFSPDGSRLASASHDLTVRLWDLETGEAVHTIQAHDDLVLDVAFSPDGKWIATSSHDQTARLWTPVGELVETLRGHTAAVHDVAFSPNAATLATASLDGTVRLWRVGNQAKRTTEDGGNAARLRIRLEPPEPAGDGVKLLAEFQSPSTEPISRQGVAAEDSGWRITANESRSVRLFEVPVKQPVDGSTLIYRARMKTKDLKGRAYLEMWVRLPGRGEFFSKGFHHAVSGTNGWASYEVPFFLKEGEQPDRAKLNLVIEGPGTVWMEDVQLLQVPAAPN